MLIPTPYCDPSEYGFHFDVIAIYCLISQLTLQKYAWTVIMLLSLLVLAAARPQEFDEDDDIPGQGGEDKRDDIARVQIKVYRGPTKNDGYAPWGYWVKQPSDDQ